MRQSLLLHSKLHPVLCILLGRRMIDLIVLRLYRFEVGHIQAHLWQSLDRLYNEEEDQTNHCFSSAQPNETQETYSLVYHQSTNCDLFASY